MVRLAIFVHLKLGSGVENSREFGCKLRAYVLRQVSAQEVEHLEARIFADPEAFALLIETEEGLVEQFERGQLSRGDEKNFKKALANSERLRELWDLYRWVKPRPAGYNRKSVLRWLPVASIASIVIAVALFKYWDTQTPKQPLSSPSPHSPASLPKETLKIIAELKQPEPRGNGKIATGTDVKVTPAIQELILRLPANTIQGESLTASVRAADDPAIVWHGTVSRSGQNEYFLSIPNTLQQNDYIATIFSHDVPIADFYFRLRVSN